MSSDLSRLKQPVGAPPTPPFRQTAAAQDLAFASAPAFGTLALNGAEGPLTAHLPFLELPDGVQVDRHLVGSNPVAPHLKEKYPGGAGAAPP